MDTRDTKDKPFQPWCPWCPLWLIGVRSYIVTSNRSRLVTPGGSRGRAARSPTSSAIRLAFPLWWPSVYRDVRETAPAGRERPGPAHRAGDQGVAAVHDPMGVRGRRVALSRTAWQSPRPATSTAAACGRSSRAGRFVDITYDWRLRAEKPLLRRLSFLLKPLFASNHRWAMAQGEQSLRLELLRRRATSAASLDGVAPPPGPVTYAASRSSEPPRWSAERSLI